MNLGYTVSIPCGDAAHYDLVLDIDHKLYKLQCKSPSYSNGSIFIYCTTNINTRTRLETYSYSSDDVDFFCTYYDSRCYLIPFSECSDSFTLRVDDPISPNSKNIHWAENYEADLVIRNIGRSDKVTFERNIGTAKSKIYQYHWITNGKDNRRFFGDIDDIPEGFVQGRSGKSNQYT